MMAESVFDDKLREPTARELDYVLDTASGLLAGIEQSLRLQFGEMVREWKFYGKKAGWTLALTHRGRRAFHLIPRNGFFTVVLTLGERAVSACEERDLPAWVLSALRDARPYAEGRSIRIDVTTADDVVVVEELVKIKFAN